MYVKSHDCVYAATAQYCIHLAHKSLSAGKETHEVVGYKQCQSDMLQKNVQVHKSSCPARHQCQNSDATLRNQMLPSPAIQVQYKDWLKWRALARTLLAAAPSTRLSGWLPGSARWTMGGCVRCLSLQQCTHAWLLPSSPHEPTSREPHPCG